MPLMTQILVWMNFLPIKKKAIKKIILVVTIGALIVIFAGNIATVDQAAYNDIYMGMIPSGYFEKGYQMLCSISRSIGIDYKLFKLIISGMAIFLLKKAFSVDSKVWSTAISIWALTSFWHDAEQSRFTMAYIVVLYAFKYLNAADWKSQMKYCLCILLAGQLHTAAYIYFVLVLLFTRNKNGVIFFIDFLAISFSLFVAINGNDMSFVGDVLYKITKYERIRMWFNFKTNFGYLGVLLLQILLHALLYYAKTILGNSQAENKFYEKKIVGLAFDVNALLFVALPLYMVSTDFIRIIRGMFLFDYMALAIAYYNASKVKNKYCLACGIAIFGITYNLYIFGSPIGAFSSDYFMSMITKNSLL